MGRVLKSISALIAALSSRERAPVLYAPEEDYEGYLQRNAADGETLEAERERAKRFLHQPLFTILITDKSPDDARLKRTRAALEAQSYANYELIVRPDTGTGDYVLPISAGDILAPDALFRFTQAIESEPETDFIFADDDVMGDGGIRERPHFKPELSKETLLSYNSVGRPLVVSRALFDAAGGTFGKGEYAFALDCQARAKRAEHIAAVLLSRFKRPEPEPASRGIAAISRYLETTGEEGYAAPGLYQGSFRVRTRTLKAGVSVIVANLNGVDALRRLLESIEANTMREGVEIIIADGGSREARLMRYYAILEKNRAARIIRGNEANVATLCNAAAEAAMGDMLLFVSRDATVLTPDWIGALLEQINRRGVGAAGPKIIDENRRLLHVGGVAGLLGLVESPYAGEPDDGWEMRKNGFANAVRRVSSLSIKCMMVNADAFFAAGGFDEGFSEAGADVELGIRLAEKRLSCVYTPFATLMLHGEGVYPKHFKGNDRMRVYDVLRPLIMQGDPYYSPAFDLNSRIPVVKAADTGAIGGDEAQG